MSMSESTHTAPTVEHADEEDDTSEVEALRDEVADLRGMVYDQQRTIEEQGELIDELREEQNSRAAVRWDSRNPREVEVELPNDEDGYTWGVGEAVLSSVQEISDNHDRIRNLERGEVDPTDLVGTGADDYELPIEETVAKVRNDVAENPSANKMRATVVFRAFGGRARSVSGKMVLESGDVKNILEDPKKCGISDPNPNTVRRTMEQCAKLTSKKPAKERDHTDPENLLTVEKRKGRRALVADRDEWQSYTDDVQERIDG